MSIHPANKKITTLAQLHELRKANEPLFACGMVYATPAAMLHLVQNVHPPQALLKRHSYGDYGDLCAEDKALNDQAIIDGGRILSAYHIEGQKLYVITEAETDDGVRTTTTILFAGEY